MKMKQITCLLFAVLLSFTAQTVAFAAPDVEYLKGNLYIQDDAIVPGESTNLSIQLENTIEICGFQFFISFPKGITISALTVSDSRNSITNNQYASIVRKVSEVDNRVSYLCIFANTSYAAFTGNSGEIATLTINADPGFVEGQYEAQLSGVRVVKASDTSAPHVQNSSFQLTVKSFDEDYGLKVQPFALKEEITVPIMIDLASSVADVEFDVVFPTELEDDYDVVRTLSNKQFSTKIKFNGETAHVKITHIGDNSIQAENKTKVATLELDYPESNPNGLYPLTLKNIQMKGVDGNKYLPAPYTTEIFVGEEVPTATVTDGVATFHGDYSNPDMFELLKASLPTGATVDLRDVSGFAEDPTTLRTDNVIVTNDKLGYGRLMSNTWGSLCLPFPIESNESIQLYELSSVSSSALTFDPVQSVEANTPVFFKKRADDGFSVATENDDNFDIQFATTTPTPTESALENENDYWVLNGSYITETIDVREIQAYGLMNNEFHRFTKSLTAGAFRAWLQHIGTAQNATIRIDDSTEGIHFIEQDDSSVKMIFDIQGRPLHDGSSQQFIIENGQKKFNK